MKSKTAVIRDTILFLLMIAAIAVIVVAAAYKEYMIWNFLLNRGG